MILVFDVTNRKSFEALDNWVREANKCGAEKPTVIVCGNKKDLSGRREVDNGDAKSWASSRKYRYHEVSCKDGQGV